MNESRRFTLGFVDANILADGILAENRIDEIRREAQEHDDFDRIPREMNKLFKSYKPARQAYQLLLALQPPRNRLEVVTSNLALLEARSVIVDEYIQRQVSRQGIPSRAWSSVSSKMRLSKEDHWDLSMGILRFQTRLAEALRIHDSYNINLASDLVQTFRCHARDAILVATAISCACKTFISRDDRLKRQLRTFKKIRVTDAQTVLNEMGAVLRIGEIKYSGGNPKNESSHLSTER